ncbi:MAG: hypothetical protein GY762_05710 [Proteobacteria bacterium]|nr:hypothetical protein [Pseudomonadota bacterium]
MAYRRVTAPREMPGGKNLTQAMAGIGMRFAAKPSIDPNIEDTLLAASLEGMERHALRVLSVLVTWLQAHHQWINADRLIRLVTSWESPEVRAFWAATAAWLQKDRRFVRMTKLYAGPRVDVLPVGTDFQIIRSGEDPRFEGTCLRVPAGIFRARPSDVLKPSELAQIHRIYRQRVLMGPTYRADMWAVLESDPSLTATELARLTYGSFATAWQVKKDFEILAA